MKKVQIFHLEKLLKQILVWNIVAC